MINAVERFAELGVVYSHSDCAEQGSSSLANHEVGQVVDDVRRNQFDKIKSQVQRVDKGLNTKNAELLTEYEIHAVVLRVLLAARRYREACLVSRALLASAFDQFFFANETVDKVKIDWLIERFLFAHDEPQVADAVLDLHEQQYLSNMQARVEHVRSGKNRTISEILNAISQSEISPFEDIELPVRSGPDLHVKNRNLLGKCAHLVCLQLGLLRSELLHEIETTQRAAALRHSKQLLAFASRLTSIGKLQERDVYATLRDFPSMLVAIASRINQVASFLDGPAVDHTLEWSKRASEALRHIELFSKAALYEIQWRPSLPAKQPADYEHRVVVYTEKPGVTVAHTIGTDISRTGKSHDEAIGRLLEFIENNDSVCGYESIAKSEMYANGIAPVGVLLKYEQGAHLRTYAASKRIHRVSIVEWLPYTGRPARYIPDGQDFSSIN